MILERAVSMRQPLFTLWCEVFKSLWSEIFEFPGLFIVLFPSVKNCCRNVALSVHPEGNIESNIGIVAQNVAVSVRLAATNP